MNLCFKGYGDVTTHLLCNHRQHLQFNSVELIKASPGPSAGQTLEELQNKTVTTEKDTSTCTTHELSYSYLFPLSFPYPLCITSHTPHPHSPHSSHPHIGYISLSSSPLTIPSSNTPHPTHLTKHTLIPDPIQRTLPHPTHPHPPFPTLTSHTLTFPMAK